MKRIILLITAALLVVSPAGCSTDSLEAYRKAAQKTDDIKMGRTSGEFTVALDFSTEGMTEEQIKELNYLRNIKGNFSTVYDRNGEKGIYRNYLNLGGLGFDFDLYMNREEAFMKLPIIGKYMRIDEFVKDQQESESAPKTVSRVSQAAISEKWLDLLKKEDVFKGKDIILTTPDGEVKTTQYTIALKDEQVKSLASDCIKILSSDEEVKKNYESFLQKNVKSLKEISFEKMMSDMEKNLDNYKLESFSYNAYVDIDGYIVNERVELALKAAGSGTSGMTGLSYKLEIKNWDINKKQNFEFPVLTEENTLKSDEMDRNLPFMFEGMLNKAD